jgi:hypothetical protein
MQVDGSAPAMPRDETDFEPWLRLVDRLDATFAAAGGGGGIAGQDEVGQREAAL